MGLLDKLFPRSAKERYEEPASASTSGYRTLTEHAPAFPSWDGTLYEHALTKSIIERIAVACSKLKPEFVTPDGSNGSIPRVQNLVASFPNESQTWPDFLRRLATSLYVDTVAYVVPQLDPRDPDSVIGLWPLRPAYTEVVEYEGEPYFRFRLVTGDVQAYPYRKVAVLTRFQLESDVFGGGNLALAPTIRLMDAQRQAEEIALKTGADIRFIGKVATLTHEDSLTAKRDKFAEDNFGQANRSGLLLYDKTFEDLRQIKVDHFTVDPDEMTRIEKALYAYFGINEKILSSDFDEATWNAFYENVVEPFALMLGERLSLMLLTPTQVRKGNRIMFSSSYLAYASTDSKIKVANLLTTTGSGTKNEVRDIFQLPRLEDGDVFMVRGEIYITDEHNNIIAESGGHGDGASSREPWDDLDEPGQEGPDDLTRALNARVAQMVERRLRAIPTDP